MSAISAAYEAGRSSADSFTTQAPSSSAARRRSGPRLHRLVRQLLSGQAIHLLRGGGASFFS